MSVHESESVCETLERSVQHVVVIVDVAGKLNCLPPVLDVTGTDVLLSFALKGSDWVFPERGAVRVKDGAGQFPYPSWTINGKQAALFDCNTAPGQFSYTLTVQHAITGQLRRLDPTINNEA